MMQSNPSHQQDPSTLASVIGELATQALLVEANLHPKPGLVTARSTGSHSDMDIETFRQSAAALKPFMVEFSRLGLTFCGTNLTKLLAQLRPVGMQAEQEMMTATSQVNTHKGAIFILGVLCAALGYMKAQSIKISPLHVQDTIRKMCKGITGELDSTQTTTAGEHAFKQHGVTGIRGEAETGFPTLMQGLNAYKRAKRDGYEKPQALQFALMTCISINDDSCLIKRGGLSGLNFAKEQAKSILQSNLDSRRFNTALQRLDIKFVERNLSPGGSADCLSAIWLISMMESFSS
ncbi:2-(5''-triphosphoribosyl)-3'-dephosphocoenzyme-A synthase [Vibrio ishigakensis]|uniref:Probable 2-(5''-triphosphoribosyl)-3'-dephosphocoenzyme-A synthase n=1 Tax=Vibrio ishigakensis TaxID=1481914 RepID=A0A0B8QDY3_9VIBR|nr:2-(5''-triphosphoribosyl)-3'-dephosphocoenzyme-A synthase [Vibrio ishigakensis]